MKKLLLLLLPMCYWSCLKNNDSPKTENITKGSKWNIQIGSNPQSVYSQLQQMDLEKTIGSVSIVGRTFFKNIDSLKSVLTFYNAFTVESSTGRVDRALFQIDNNKIKSIENGSSMLDSTPNWPKDVAKQASIFTKDSLDIVYKKLTDLLQTENYNTYFVILPDKPLNRPFDPDTKNYPKWYFTFFEKVNNAGRYKRYSVSLLFSNNKLNKIIVTTEESQTYD